MNIIITEEEAALLDAALSVLDQNMVSQIGAIKEGIQEYGGGDKEEDMLKGAMEVRQDIKSMLTKIGKVQHIIEKSNRMNRLKKFKKR